MIDFDEKKNRRIAQAKTKATDHQWELVDSIIKSFIATYPKQWIAFTNMLKAERTTYQLATKDNKEMRQANWRNVLAFPVIEDNEGNQVDSIKPLIDKIIPELTHRDSVNMPKFIKKYPMLCPAEKY